MYFISPGLNRDGPSRFTQAKTQDIITAELSDADIRACPQMVVLSNLGCVHDMLDNAGAAIDYFQASARAKAFSSPPNSVCRFVHAHTTTLLHVAIRLILRDRQILMHASVIACPKDIQMLSSRD
jgi:hypothetical protein